VLLLFSGQSLAAAATEECRDLFANRRLTLIVPYTPGGGYDTYARLFATVFAERTGTRVVVRNITGAGGMIGIRTIAESNPDNLVLGIINPIILLDSKVVGLSLPDYDAFAYLGAVITDTAIAVSVSEADLATTISMGSVVGAVDTELIRTQLAAEALGWPIRIVRGYAGSSDRWLALLRGEIDALFGTTESMGNRVRNSPETKALLSLTEGPNSEFPEIPYLSGAGSVVDIGTRELAPSEREARIHLAYLAAKLSVKPRAIAVTAAVNSLSHGCLVEAVEDTLFSEALSQASNTQALQFEPTTAAEVNRIVAEVNELMVENSQLLQTTFRELQSGR